MSDSEEDFEILAPSDKPTKHFRSSRFRTKRTRDACTSLQLSDIQDANFFAGRSPEFINAVADFAEFEVYTKGEIIMQEGDEGDKMYFLHRGKVDVLVGPDMSKISTLEAGSVLGELSLMGSMKRTATIRAAELCDCRALHKHTFERLLRKFPEERAAFVSTAKRRLASLKDIRSKSEQPRHRRSLLGLPGAGTVEVKLFRPHRLSLSRPGVSLSSLSRPSASALDIPGRRSAPAVMDPGAVHGEEPQQHNAVERARNCQEIENRVMQIPILPPIVDPSNSSMSSRPGSNRLISKSVTLPTSSLPEGKASITKSVTLPAPSGPLDAMPSNHKDLVDKLRTSNCHLREQVSNLRQNLQTGAGGSHVLQRGRTRGPELRAC